MTYIYIFLHIDTCHNEYSPHNFSLYLLNQKIKICVGFCFWSLCIKKGNRFQCFWLFSQKQMEGGGPKRAPVLRVAVRAGLCRAGPRRATREPVALLRWPLSPSGPPAPPAVWAPSDVHVGRGVKPLSRVGYGAALAP